MRILHSGDWHLGKQLSGYDLYENQQYALSQLYETIVTKKIEALVIAGDIYDSKYPKDETIQQFEEILLHLVKNFDLYIFIIHGNHDSYTKLCYGKKLLQHNKIYFSNENTIYKIEVDGVCFYLFPYYYPTLLNVTVEEHVKKEIQELNLDTNKKNIAIYHGFVGDNVITSDSERLVIGGIDKVSAEVFSNFDYVALGHLHAYQEIIANKMYYCGSLCYYSKSEVKQKKCFVIYDTLDNSVELVAIQQFRKLRIIRDNYEKLLLDKSQDYVYFELLDTKKQYNAMQNLKENYPHAVELKYVNIEKEKVNIQKLQKINQDRYEDFCQFYQQYYQEPLNENQQEIMKKLFEEYY